MHLCSCLAVKLSSVILTMVFMLVVVSSLFQNRDYGVESSSRRLVSEVSTKRIESMQRSSASGGSTKQAQRRLLGGEESLGSTKQAHMRLLGGEESLGFGSEQLLDYEVVPSSRRLVSEVSTKRIESMRRRSVSGGSTKQAHKRRLLGGEESLAYGSQHLRDCQWIPNVTVTKDGSGDYRTISSAIASIPRGRTSKFIIHVRKGVYNEMVVVPKYQENIVMFGDGSAKTVVYGRRNKVDSPSIKTIQTATFAVYGDGFIARDIKFVNIAGPYKNQAVAFYSRSTNSAIYRCIFQGYQDTLYVHAGDQIYRECTIIGTVDFIFGAARAVFQKCWIYPRHPLEKQVDTVTAQSATDGIMKSGFTIINSRILPYEGSRYKDVAYLGRPWRSYSKVIVIKSYLGSLINGKGWLAWNNTSDPPPPTITYGEYQNYGPGAGLANRVKWAGYQPEMTYQEALKFTVNSQFTNHAWLDKTCIPYDGSM